VRFQVWQPLETPEKWAEVLAAKMALRAEAIEEATKRADLLHQSHELVNTDTLPDSNSADHTTHSAACTDEFAALRLEVQGWDILEGDEEGAGGDDEWETVPLSKKAVQKLAAAKQEAAAPAAKEEAAGRKREQQQQRRRERGAGRGAGRGRGRGYDHEQDSQGADGRPHAQGNEQSPAEVLGDEGGGRRQRRGRGRGRGRRDGDGSAVIDDAAGNAVIGHDASQGSAQPAHQFSGLTLEQLLEADVGQPRHLGRGGRSGRGGHKREHGQKLDTSSESGMGGRGRGRRQEQRAHGRGAGRGGIDASHARASECSEGKPEGGRGRGRQAHARRRNGAQGDGPVQQVYQEAGEDGDASAERGGGGRRGRGGRPGRGRGHGPHGRGLAAAPLQPVAA
jgi:hypothetical protein